MNAASIMKLMNHPKFEAFLKSVFSKPMEEGSVIEIMVTRPGEEPVTANIKVLQSDLELIEELKELSK